MIVDKFSLFATAAESFAFIMAVVLMAGILQRKDRGRLMNSSLMATLFSASLVLCMSDQIDLGFAGVYDLRGLLIGSAIALFGPVVGGVTLLTGLFMRLHIGGPGVLAGSAAMFLAFGGGLLWRRNVQDADLSVLFKGVVLGICISMHVLAILLLPYALWGDLFAQMAPFFLSANVVGALLFHSLLRNEIAVASEISRLKRDADTDPLTGLLNRRGLDELAPVLAHNADATRGRALLCLDIDKFKNTNDAYGHAAGDAVLKECVQRVAAQLHRRDIFARLGGDEFVIVLPDVSHRDALSIAECCRAAVADRVVVSDDICISMSISIGAIWQKDPAAVDVMMRTADFALYQAKNQGRNTVVVQSELAPVISRMSPEPAMLAAG